MQNLIAEKFQVFSARPVIPSDKLISGTDIDGVVKLDYSSIPANYVIVGHDCYCDTEEIGNFTYGSIARDQTFRFVRKYSNKGFIIYAYAIKLN